MKHGSSLRRWRPTRVVALALVIALTPLPLLAGQPGKTGAPISIRGSASAICMTEPLAATPRPAAQAGTHPADAGSSAFFKKPVGIAILATFAAGIGYALYSVKHDRVKSPAKQ